MPKILMSEVIAMLYNREFSIPVESLTKTQRIDRKSVVQGKSVDLGGRRIIKKKIDKYTDFI